LEGRLDEADLLHDHAIWKEGDAGRGRPGGATIDSNALWDSAYAPLIKELGYDPVRADQAAPAGARCSI
jgi:hypothetical protein